jgi:hypothetical protein
MVLIEYLFAASLLGANSVSAYAVPSVPYQTPLGSESKRFSKISEHTSLVPPNDNLDKWITEESEFAWEYLLDNVAPYGKNTEGAAPGTVIASPSKSYPDYFYQWVRDAAITMKGVVNAYAKTDFQDLRDTVERYLEIQENIQSTANPSGGYSSGGLGEPKFMVNGEPFTQLVLTLFGIVVFILSLPLSLSFSFTFTFAFTFTFTSSFSFSFFFFPHPFRK